MNSSSFALIHSSVINRLFLNTHATDAIIWGQRWFVWETVVSGSRTSSDCCCFDSSSSLSLVIQWKYDQLLKILGSFIDVVMRSQLSFSIIIWTLWFYADLKIGITCFARCDSWLTAERSCGPGQSGINRGGVALSPRLTAWDRVSEKRCSPFCFVVFSVSCSVWTREVKRAGSVCVRRSSLHLFVHVRHREKFKMWILSGFEVISQSGLTNSNWLFFSIVENNLSRRTGFQEKNEDSRFSLFIVTLPCFFKS